MDWVKAPPLVELEIRGVWLEDDMPDEIKNAPGRVPFTLSAESQEWVDSMQEVKDAGKYIVGLPRPAAPVHHRPLGAQSSPAQPAPRPQVTPVTPPASSAPPARPAPRSVMPDIETPPQAKPAPERPRMPDIEDGAPTRVERAEASNRPAMPDIGPDGGEGIDRPRMPDIGED